MKRHSGPQSLRSIHWRWILPLVALLLLGTLSARGQEPPRFENDIRQFETADRKSPPRSGGLLFVGSSSIRMWDLEKSFPYYPVINRGFGGSEMTDLVRYMDRIVIPYRPRLIVLYEGDNDIASGKKPAEIFATFQKFANRLADRLPVTQVVVLSIKPSPSRWELYPQMQETNDLIRRYCEQKARYHFVDVGSVLLNAQGEPDERFYQKDGLHLNEEGYAQWAKVVEPFLNTP